MPDEVPDGEGQRVFLLQLPRLRKVCLVREETDSPMLADDSVNTDEDPSELTKELTKDDKSR